MNAPPVPDEFQQRVIDAPEQSIRVVAPAGSGKTETLARRVESRIRQGVAPRRILVLTFDRNAAESFRAKLRRGGMDQGPRVETLNAYGYGLLRQHFGEERTKLITEPFWPGTKYLNTMVNDYGLQTFTSMLEKIKNQTFDPRSVDRTDLGHWIAQNKVHLLRDLENEEIGSKVSAKQFGFDLASEFLAYEKFLQDRGGIDFDDQKLRPLIRLRKNHRLLEEIQETVDEVIVDEFQDINKLDCELISLISSKATLVVTGDDDQAIYGFRGASAEYLIAPDDAFARKFVHYELSVNYRCPKRILTSAGSLIVENEVRIEKHPTAAKDFPGTIEVIAAKDVAAETAKIALRAGRLLRGDDGNVRRVAVLARTNQQLFDIQAAMIRAETPFEISVTNDIRITWEAARKILLFGPVIREQTIPPPEVRAEVIGLFASSRRMGHQQVSRLKRLAEQDEMAFPGIGVMQVLPERFRHVLSSSIMSIRKSTTLTSDLEALEEFLNTIVSRAMEGGKRANQQSRLSGMIDLSESWGTNREAFGEEMNRLISVQREALRRPSHPKVTLSTCHGAKGQEWHVVFVPHCNEGLFPDARSDEGEYLEAERKLFYVSMTRASEHLVLSWSRELKRSREGTGPSPFLIEAGLVQPPKRSAPQQRGSRYAAPKKEPRYASQAVPRTSQRSNRPPRMLSLMSPRSRMAVDGLDVPKVLSMATWMQRDEEKYSVPLIEMAVRYQPHDPEASIPLQAALLLKGIPFAIQPEHRLTEQPLFQAVRQAWQKQGQPLAGSFAADTVMALEKVLATVIESNDRRRWTELIERATEDAIGDDPEGVQFVAG